MSEEIRNSLTAVLTLDPNNAVVRYLWLHASYSSAIARLHGGLDVGASEHGLGYNANLPLGGGPTTTKLVYLR